MEQHTTDLTQTNQHLQAEIAQRRRAERELQAERDFITAVLDTAATLIVVLDRDGRIVRFNRACEALTHYAFCEVQGARPWEFLIVSEEVAEVKAVYEELKAGRFPNKHENYWVTKDGRQRLIAWTNTVLLDADGEVEFIIGTGIDITERKHTALLLEAGESLQRVTAAVLHRFTTLNEVLNITCTEARQLIGAAGSAVILLEDDTWLRMAASSGLPAPILDRLSLENSLAGLVVQQQQPLLLDGLKGNIQTHYPTPAIETLLAVPLQIDTNIIGVLEVVNKPGGFAQEDIRLIDLFADHAAIAIENARLQQQAEQLAVVNERQRLARELHDSVTQALYSVSLYADATRLALAAGKEAVAGEHVEELRKMAREAMLDMRLLIFELRPPVLEKEGLVAALQARLEAVEARSGLQTEFHVDAEEARLPLTAEEELYRIAQEALTNAVKHARASQVSVRLDIKEERFCLQICDDGQGFDLRSAGQSGGLGLRSMRERVQRIGGELIINSRPGEGTTLHIEGSMSGGEVAL